MSEITHPLENGSYDITVKPDVTLPFSVESSYQDANEVWRYNGFVTITDGDSADVLPLNEVPQTYFKF